jgi:hypothetical protein
MPSLFEPPAYPLVFAAGRRTDGRADLRPSPAMRRVRRGIYIAESTWAGLDADDRYRAFISATLACSPTSPVVSHLSAAALWGLHIVGPWPTTVHTTVLDRTGGRSSGLYIRHRTSTPPAVVIVGGIRCTTIARTIADVARSGARASALAMADHALAAELVSSDDVTAEDLRLGVGRGSRQSRSLLALASPLAANGGESFARLVIHDAGLAAPVLQFRVDDADGLVGYTDFAWPQVGVVLEFDGRLKYSAARFVDGQSPEEIVWREKRREDRLRAGGWNVVRAVWEDLHGPSPRVIERLTRAGVPRRRQIGVEGAM